MNQKPGVSLELLQAVAVIVLYCIILAELIWVVR